MTFPPSLRFEASAPVRYGIALLACAAVTLVALPLQTFLDQANIVMLFLLAVFLVAVFLGRGAAVMASFLGVALFDFFFVPPHFSFAVADAQYLVTFAVMLAVGLVSAHLVSRLTEATLQSQGREAETRQLYEIAKSMGRAATTDQLESIVLGYLDARNLDGSLLVADAGKLSPLHDRHHELGGMERTFAQSAFSRNEIVEADSLVGLGIAIAFFPMRAPIGTRGVLAVIPRSDDASDLRGQRKAIEALASLAALSLERLFYADATREAELKLTEERLRTSVLSSLSHDLRTPLTALVGLADTLSQRGHALPADIAETAEIIRDQAQAMHRLVSDLLDMARLHGADSVLRREWQPFEDVVGSSLRLAEGAAPDRRVDVRLPAGLPLICFDAVLIERVLCNLFDNAFKYAPKDARVTLSAAIEGDALRVSVCNEGSHFPPERIASMFDLFVRGTQESNIPGIGLGLAICKAIVVAHGGDIEAENRPDGVCIRFSLPCGTPPPLEEEE